MDAYPVVFFCLAITLHNIEEAIWLPRWSQQTSKFQKPVTSGEFRFAVICITVLAYLSAFSFAYRPESDAAKWMFAGFLGSMIVNAIFPHLIVTLLTKKYAPGLLSGLLLNLPINSWVICRMFADHSITWKELVLSTLGVGIGLLTLIPVWFKIGRHIASSEPVD
ncbi:HXXEE domain-containing protein [Saccharibacillus qingshengii]|uniref:HXXEE domain-containing protein n=1 Tax=Saccharibacillus qingshengii TaxID=1763540 RepID=UPI00155814B2|nr:HXXEE domain-containing protein [Saccharibacillus qingshengii]